MWSFQGTAMASSKADGDMRIMAVDGVLDTEAARRLCDTLLQLAPGTRTVIDCHGAREIDDSALAFLAISLHTASRSVEMRGLGEQQLSMLRHVGLLQRA